MFVRSIYINTLHINESINKIRVCEALLDVDAFQLFSTSLGVQVLVVVSGVGPDRPDNGEWNGDVQDLGLESSEGVEDGSVNGTVQWSLRIWRNGVDRNTLLLWRSCKKKRRRRLRC